MPHVMNNTEIFLIAMLIIFTVPFLIWRYFRTDFFAPLVVVQIIMGIVLGPGVLGALIPEYYNFVFTPTVIQNLNGIAWWAVMIFVFIAGVELDLTKAWQYKRESGITAGLALGVPLLLGSITAIIFLQQPGWAGPAAQNWQFAMGIGMSCSVTALPILILLMEKMDVLRQPIGQRILRYASLDDIAIWAVLAFILLDWERMGRQALFLASFGVIAYYYRKLMVASEESDRWYFALIWLAACGLFADWVGLHFMVGAFLAGAVTESKWFNQEKMDMMRHHVLLVVMPVFFLSTGLRTNWGVGGQQVFVAAAILLLISVGGKLLGVHLAGKILRWEKGESAIIGWFLQTKALIMIIFANVLLDKHIITNDTFTALLVMAVASTMLTVPMVSARLARMSSIISRAS